MIGAWPTIALVFLTAMVGLSLLRQQGFSTLMRVNQKLESGQLPAQEVLEGIFLAVGGALLLTPGFITDSIGFACLLPFTRRLLVQQWLKHVTVAEFHSFSAGGGFQQGSQGGDVFEGEFKKEGDDPRHLP